MTHLSKNAAKHLKIRYRFWEFWASDFPLCERWQSDGHSSVATVLQFHCNYAILKLIFRAFKRSSLKVWSFVKSFEEQGCKHFILNFENRSTITEVLSLGTFCNISTTFVVNSASIFHFVEKPRIAKLSLASLCFASLHEDTVKYWAEIKSHSHSIKFGRGLCAFPAWNFSSLPKIIHFQALFLTTLDSARKY